MSTPSPDAAGATAADGRAADGLSDPVVRDRAPLADRPPGSPPPALLFDLDGTLADSRASIRRVWEWYAERHGLDVEAVMASQHGRRAIDTIALVTPTVSAQAEQELVERRQAEDTDDVVPIPGAVELVAATPRERLAVVTSGSPILARARLAAIGIPVPEVFVTEDLVAAGKPHPEGFLLAASRLGVEPRDCVVLEDAPAGVAAGRAAGMTVIGVLTEHDAHALAAAHAVVADLRGAAAAIERLSSGR